MNDVLKAEVTLTALNAVQKSVTKNNKIINATTIQENSTAQIVSQCIYEEILSFQSSLADKDDVVLCIVQFNESFTLYVDSIGYIGYNLIRFGGKDSSGKPLELIQHVSQLNFLMKVAEKQNPEVPKRKIGFVVD